MKAQDLAELSYHLVCLRSLGYRTARDRGLAPREYELLLEVSVHRHGSSTGTRAHWSTRYTSVHND